MLKAVTKHDKLPTVSNSNNIQFNIKSFWPISSILSLKQDYVLKCLAWGRLCICFFGPKFGSKKILRWGAKFEHIAQSQTLGEALV